MRIGLNTALLACLAASLLPGTSSARPGDATAWGARNPGACPSIRSAAAPNLAQVAQLLRCRHEVIVSDGGELWLMENLVVSIGAGMPYAAAYDSYVMEEADVRARVYPLRGSYTWSVCMTRRDAAIYGSPDTNCRESDVPSAKGICWKTTFGDWSCRLQGAAVGRRERTRPPMPLAARPRTP